MEKSILLQWQAAQVNVCYEPIPSIVIKTTQDLTNLLTTVLGPSMPQTPYTALLLTKTNHLIGWADITTPRKSGPNIDTKKLVGSVYATQCHRVVVVHLRSGSASTPLDSEYMLSFKLQVMLATHDAFLKDLIIWGGSDYFSFAEDGLLMAE